MIKKRNIGEELLEAIQDIKDGNGRTRRVDTIEDIKRIRNELRLSQVAFSSLMGISTRTLQEWEQGRRKPTGSALSLLRIAQKHPEAFVEI